MTSGDDDFNDQDAEAFIPLFTDIHANNRLGNMDFGINSLSGVFGILGGSGVPGLDTGVTDLNIRFNGNYGNHNVLFAYHYLAATTLDEVNVFPAGYSSSLGGMLDIGYGYTYTKNVSFGLELSVFEPGDFFKDFNTGPPNDLFESTITRVAGEVRLRF